MRVLARTPRHTAAITIPVTIDSTGYPGILGMPVVTTDVTVVVVVEKAVWMLVPSVVMPLVAVEVCVAETKLVDVPTILVE